MRARGSRRAVPTAGRSRRSGAAIGWAIGVFAIALFGVAGAAVASGQVRIFAAEPSATASVSPSATPTPTRTPTPTPTPTPSPTPPPPPAPVSPADTPCATAVTMSVWAHYDDDLIFANPTLQDAIAAGNCTRSVFLTASDAGRGTGYSKSRELGILRAYNTMRGQEGFWSEKGVTLLSGAVLSQWSPDDDPDITVTFLRMPDGNMNGAGFPSTGHASLPQLLSGSIGSLAPIDGSPPLSSEALIASLAEAHPGVPPGATDHARPLDGREVRRGRPPRSRRCGDVRAGRLAAGGVRGCRGPLRGRLPLGLFPGQRHRRHPEPQARRLPRVRRAGPGRHVHHRCRLPGQA